MGALAEVFENRNIPPSLTADVGCDAGEHYEIFTEPDRVRKVNCVVTALDAREKITKDILAVIALEIEPIYAWLLLSIRTVR